MGVLPNRFPMRETSARDLRSGRKKIRVCRLHRIRTEVKGGIIPSDLLFAQDSSVPGSAEILAAGDDLALRQLCA